MSDRLNDAIKHFITVIDERAPSDIDIEAGTNDAPWWQDLKKAFFDVEDQVRALVRDHAAVTRAARRILACEGDVYANRAARELLRAALGETDGRPTKGLGT